MALSEAEVASARNEFTGRLGAAVIDARNMRLFALAMTVIAICLVVALVVLMPLKTVVPHVVEVNKITGEARAVGAGVAAATYKPDETARTYWLSLFVDYVIGIDPRKDITEDRIERATLLTRGKATEQFAGYLRKTAPIKTIIEDVNFSRRVSIRAVNFIRDSSTATVQVRVDDQTVGRPISTRNYIVKVDYAFLPPKGLQDITRNPLGIYVIDFVINEDVR
jgi:type IV secretion system protein VirB8